MNLFRNFYCYAVRAASIAAAGTDVQTLTFSSDTDFMLAEIRTSGTAGNLLTITDAQGAQHSNISLQTALIGAGTNKIVFPEPVNIPASSQIIISQNNSTGAPITNQEVQFWGYQKQRQK